MATKDAHEALVRIHWYRMKERSGTGRGVAGGGSCPGSDPASVTSSPAVAVRSALIDGNPALLTAHTEQSQELTLSPHLRPRHVVRKRLPGPDEPLRQHGDEHALDVEIRRIRREWRYSQVHPKHRLPGCLLRRVRAEPQKGSTREDWQHAEHEHTDDE